MIGNEDVRVPMSKFDGWTIVQTDTSPPPSCVKIMRLRAPDGRETWVALCGMFGLTGIESWELKPGHHELARIERAKRAQAEFERLERQAGRRAILSASVDHCPPHGIPRPAGVAS